MTTPRIESCAVSRAENGELTIAWQVTPGGHPVSVSISNDARAMHSERIADACVESRVTVNIPGRQRNFFHLNPDGGTGATVAERVLPLDGASNFRDIGGYGGHAGQRVRWGLIYRSDYLSDLSDPDLEVLHDAGIRTVFDLRGQSERENHPSRWHADARIETLSWPDETDLSSLGGRLEGYASRLANTDGDSMRKYLCGHYRHYIELQAGKYADMFARLLETSTAPSLVHCTAGKDRTGLGVALILYLLGVEEADIYEDYLLTNHSSGEGATSARVALLLRQYGIESAGTGALEALLTAHSEYLDAAFQGMREEYGSVESYAATRLGMDAKAIEELRMLYLE